MSKLILICILIFASIFIIQFVSAATIYVDKNLTSDCLGNNYSITGRNCLGSDGMAFNTINKSLYNATAGDTVLIRNGTYSEIIRPRNSGTAGNPITYKAFEGENVSVGATLSNVPEDIYDIYGETYEGDELGIYIWKKEYIIIEGITVSNMAHQWTRIVHSNHITLQKNKFLSAGLGAIFVNSSYCKILNNTFYNGYDNLKLINCDRNLIEGNNFSMGGHSLWSIRGGNFNVIRNNYLYNEIQKIGEVVDNVRLDRPQWNFSNDILIPLKYNNTHYNLIENNTFAYLPPSPWGNATYSGIQFAGQNCIIRKNAFYNNTGGGLQFTLYDGEAENNYGNRVYNNVFYKNRKGGVYITSYTGYFLSDDILKNNILYKNDFWNTQKEDFNNSDGKPIQIFTGRESDYTFEKNNIFNNASGEDYIIADGYGEHHNLSWWQINYPSLYVNNTEVNPEFIDAANYNFKLNSSSSMIDNGTYLTRTVGVGSGTSMPVLDATYFYDGFNISGEQGDFIRLENGQAARITNINYATNTLTLDRTLSWSDGQGVSLNYYGDAPDMGVYEYVPSDPSVPRPIIASTSNCNTTLENLTCSDSINDPNGHGLNVTVFWYKNGILNLTIDYNNSYASDTLVTSTLANGSLSLGDNWSCSMRLFDGANYSIGNSTSLAIITDIVPPVFTDIANLTLYYNESLNYDINATDVTGVSCFSVNDSRFSINCSGFLANATSFNVSIYWLNISVNDTLNNINSIVIFVDSLNTSDLTLPNITVTYPQGNFNYSINVSQLNYTALDNINISSCWYSTNNGAVNSSSVPAGVNFTNVNSVEGSNTWIVYCNDTSNNINSSSVTFTVHTTAPRISFISPTPEDGASQLADSIYVNITSNDTYQHYVFSDFDRSLLLYMGMDDVNDSGDPVDLSSYSNNGSKSGNAIQTDAGKFGRAFSFDGTASIITTKIRNELTDQAAISISVWVKPSSAVTGYDVGVIREGTGSSNGVFYIRRRQYDFYQFVIYNASGDLGYTTSGNIYDTNNWTHVVGVYNGTNVLLYINGMQQGTIGNFTGKTRNSSNGNMIIGTGEEDDDVWNGIIDEVLVFNRSLSAFEVQALYNATANQYRNNFTNLEIGTHSIIGYAVDAFGNLNQTETRSLTVASPGSGDTGGSPGGGGGGIVNQSKKNMTNETGNISTPVGNIGERNQASNNTETGGGTGEEKPQSASLLSFIIEKKIYLWIIGGILVLGLSIFLVLRRKKVYYGPDINEDKIKIKMIEKMIDGGNEALNSGDIFRAREIYKEIKRSYDSLDFKDKKVRGKITNFYNKIAEER